MIQDKDLLSIQEARKHLEQAKIAQKQLATMSQEQIDNIVSNMAKTANEEARRLAEMAVEETGFGNIEDKSTKNLFAANEIYNSIKDMKTIGIITKDEAKQVWEVGQPVGIVSGITPSTNPTSTAIFKSIISVKSGNAIVFNPHPSAAKCTSETAKRMQKAAEQAGAPECLITCVTQPTIASAKELMSHELTDVILATGGLGMVKAAYSSGKPAYGVGPGNVPVYIHESADIPTATRQICDSKTFDYGTICSSEQAVIVDQTVKRKAVAEFKQQGAYFLDDHDKSMLASTILKKGKLNPEIVGKSPQVIAKMAGIVIPSDTSLLIAEEKEVGKTFPFSIETLAPILAFYTVDNSDEASILCNKLLDLGGLGHTIGIYAKDENVIQTFALEKPASRIIINSGTTFGGIGATTNIQPSMTLGCGSFGNNITSDNIGPQHLMNIKRVAFGVREMKKEQISSTTKDLADKFGDISISRKEVTEIIKSVLEEMRV